ncbi:MAG: PIN domain-containing protein [Nitrospirae bacterium]|nr:MAG: PIN domain-containing protein [Nitrospirota bacterium]
MKNCAYRRKSTLKNIPFLRVEHVASPDMDRSWKIIEKYSDKDFSFTDCTSFALMERLKLRTAFSFDSHFRQFGFNLIQLS